MESCVACRIPKLKLLCAREHRLVYWGEGWHGQPVFASCARCAAVAADQKFWVSLRVTGTMLRDGIAGLHAGAFDSLPACDQAAEHEIIEILQVPLSEEVRRQLMTAGERAGIEELLSRADGQELCIRS